MNTFYQKFTIKLILLTIILFGGFVQADDQVPLRRGEAPRTENSYKDFKDRKVGFCGDSPSSAEKLIEELDEKNQNSLDLIETLKKNINAELAAIIILKETQRAKSDYLAKIKEMRDKSSDKTAASAIQSSKELFSKAMFLSSLSQVMLDNAFTKSSNEKSICATDRYKKTALCTFTIRKTNSTEEKSLYALEDALSKITPPKSIDVKARTLEILNSIPKEFSPEVMMGLFKSKPELTGLLNSEQSDDLMKCMKNSDESCVNVFGNKDNSKKFIDVVMDQNAQISQHLQLNTEEINKAIALDKIEMDKNHKILTSVKEDSTIDLQNISNKCKSDIDSNGETSLAETSYIKLLKAQCDVNNNDKFLAESSKRIESFSSEIRSIRGKENFASTESLKSYLANKYLCLCPQGNKVIVEASTSCYRLNGVDASSTVYKLGGTVSDIIKNITFADQLANECRLPAKKLDELNDICKNVSNQNGFKAVCTIVSSENQKQQNITAEKKSWEKENEKFWIKRDPREKSGFSKTPKKTTMQLLGEGIAPAIPTLVPMWFANYQMGNHIDMLTQQALTEKQYYHTMDMYNQNPWMYGMPYFQGNYLPIGTFGSSVGKSSTTTTGTAGAGFNFAP